MDFEASACDLLESMLLDTTAEPIPLPLSLLKSITNNFSNDQAIGEGGFSVVYKGRLRNGFIAVKRLSPELDIDEKTFKNELISLIRVKHKNIVRFLGYCVDTQGKVELYQRDMVIADIRQRLLCFEFLPNGGLDKHMNDKSCEIEWGTFYQIIKGICVGLHYLHQQNIVHGDLKPANILLDDDMVPKIADFGQSRCFDENQTRAITKNLVGTLGYMAPEFISSNVITLKSDIYSLGIIIIEVLTGQKGYLHLQIENILKSWKTRFQTLLGSTWMEYARVCAEIGLKCMDYDYMKRPDMRHIIESLDKLERCTLTEIDTTQSNDRLLQTSKEIGEQEFIITTPEPSHPSQELTSEEICEQKPDARLPEPSNQVEIEMDTARSSDRPGQTSKEIGEQQSITSPVPSHPAEMAETTTLSMAKLILRHIISKAASAASNEMSLLMGVQKEMCFIKDELQTMQAFLLAPEVTERKDKLEKVWAEQVRDLSYDIEDCLDEFMVHVGNHKLSKQLIKLKGRHWIAVQIRSLKSRIKEVSSWNARNMEDIHNNSASNIDEAEVVGFNAPRIELIALIDVTTMDGPAKVICVVGMGGLGKTTLARKVYESKDTLKSFPYSAWITVSQSFSRRGMLQDMINQFFGGNAWDELLKQLAGKVLEEGLASYLRRELQDKRYFIVFDDLWETDHWNWISGIALPLSNNRGSRIIVTTRNVGLARNCTSELLIYHLKPLQKDDAVKLLLRKTNITNDDMDNDENLRTLVIKVVKKCGYLPLAILTTGGFLATKKIAEWGNFFEKLSRELECNPSLEPVRRLVTLNYNHLPSHLKPCLLYLSIFPENYEIKRSHLIGRWIAEGFVRAKIGTTVNEVGKEYFHELISRGMIQSAKLGIEGSVKTCRVHDMMRDIIVSISREENFAYLIQSNGNYVPEENFRHVAYSDSNCLKEGMDWRHVRSLTFFSDGSSGHGLDFTPSISTPKLRMLRVLDLQGENFIITQDGINKIMLLCHLKYLNIGAYMSPIYSLPNDIGKMQGLQILDMGHTYITTLPTEITKLRDLRVIRCNRIDYSCLDPEEPVRCLFATLRLPIILIGDSYRRARAIDYLHMGCSSGWSKTGGDGMRVPRGIGNLKELQILESVDVRRTSSKAIKELGELTRLRKLAIVTNGASKKKCKTLCASIEKLSPLRSLSVKASEHPDRGLGWLVSSSSPPPHLRMLWLSGYIGEMTDWFRNLTQLVKIFLEDSQLKEDKTMEILGELPKLMLLQFFHGAYLEEKLVFGTGAFLNLRTLVIWSLNNMKEMRFEEGTSPLIEMIKIGDCILKSRIIGVRHLPSLKLISLCYGSKVARLSMLEEEVNAHPNHPVLRLSHDRMYHDLRLGDVEGSNVEVEATESVPDHAGEISQVITQTTTDSEIQPTSS